ncbi:MAG TPA: amino acid adenylation domain-containing protein [Longimicrobiaceae bacterium]|jgi:amino acid adenylation domain-containing protein
MAQAGDRRDITHLLEDVYPLSPVQQGMIFHEQLAPDSGVYVNQYVFTLRGGLEPATLLRAWRVVLEQRPVLRTGFLLEGLPTPVQVVLRGDAVSWELLDWRGIPRAGQREELRRYLAAERARRFDLLAPPLMRLALVRTADGEWELAWSHHHLLLDGWSTSLVLQDVLAAYDALLAGTAPVLPRRRPFRDYVAWLGAQDLAAAEAYWRAALEGVAAATPPGVERPASAGAGGEGVHGSAGLEMGVAATGALQALARRQRITLNTLVQGAWALLLARFSGEEDVVFGTAVTGRPPELAGMEQMIGLFINTLPVRVRVEGGAWADEWLQRLHREQTAARAYEHSPLAEVQRWSGVPAGRPLFESIVAFENHPVEETAAGGRSFAVERWERVGWSHYPLELAALPGERLGLRVEYDGGRVEPDAAERMAAHLETILETLAADPARRLAAVPLLRGAERAQVLEGWNATAADWGPGCVHELVSAQAARTPGAVAVAFEGEALSYAELEARSNRLARRLRGLGVGPETRVGVCLERSAGLVVALLAVLKAGGAYVPLDPEHPAERLAYLAEDAGAPVLLTLEPLLERVPARGARLLCLDRDADGVAAESAEPLPPGAGPDNLAYVIYTSGSTGRPKGAMNTHRGVANRLLWMQAEYGLGPGDVVLQKTPFGFDVSVWELFWPLLAGARLVPARPGGHQDPAYLSELVEREGVTTLHFVPSMLRAFLEAGEPARCGSLRRVVCSGEALPYELTERFRAALPGAELHNLYGPTEAAVDVTSWRCEPRERRVVPIGRPVANTRLYVLDAAGEPAPAWVPGELHLGGVQLGRGYLGRPELTAERWVPDALSGEPGARLYRTGDRARWTSAGEVEYLGRTDFQVKVRGVRIEPGEIEAVLLEHAAVREAAVAVREDAPGDPRLVAWVVPRAGAEAAPAELRAHLRERLPEAMVPAALVVLEALPLTPSGKLDRRALPAPERESAARVAPRTPAEELLAGIWAETLSVERVGAEESFFELGGHSLLATRVVSRVREAFGVELPLREVFAAPTLAGMAGRIEALRGAGAAPPISIGRAPRDRPLPLSFAQQRLWVLDRIEPGSPAYNLPVALRVRGPLDAAALRAALDGLARRHETLRTTFAERGGVPVQVVHAPARVALPTVDLRGVQDAAGEAARLAGAEARRPFDLARGPLLRATLLRTGDEEAVVLFTVHHVASDGWSWQLFVREVSALYAAQLRGKEARLPELPVQYADFAVWQRAWLSGETLEEHVGWWRAQLAGAPALLELPTDRPRPAVPGNAAGRIAVRLEAGVAAGLRALSRREGATPFMTLLAAWQLLLARWSGQDDVLVGTPIAGRNRLETEGLIGFFVNTLVLRADLSGDPGFSGLLRQVRERTLGAYQHQALPFEKLVEELGVERSLVHTPLFQAMLVLQNDEPGEPRLGDAVVESLETGAPAAKFDLVLALEEVGGGIRGALEFRSELWDAVTVERMAGHFLAVLAGVVAAPGARTSELELMGAEERRQVLEKWNRTGADFPADRCIHQLFEAQAERTPDAVAVVFERESLTYRELNRRANRLAHHLVRLGVGPESRVGVCLERSDGLVAALLAVLKAGGAYVPLDPAYPAARLEFTLADAAVAVLLTQRSLRGAVPVPDEVRVVEVDADAEEIARESAENPASAAGPDNLAYLIYTSGSTGTPKGVAIEHRSTVALLAWASGVYSAEELDGVLAATSVCFDLSVFELFLPLCRGGRVVLVENALAVARSAAAGQVRLVNTVPSAIAALLGSGGLPAGVRTVNLAGEPLRPELVDALYARGGIERVFDLYGPSEDTTYSTWALRRPGGPATIGRPIANTRAYVLDAHGAPMPVGVPGELHLGGAGVARGYLGRPELTAGRFVPDPFGGAPGARLYRTGDRARWLASGELEYLGRLDEQVKIRGFRIEPGEVESVLTSLPGVREAAVVVREDAPGDRRLVGYVALAEGAAAGDAEAGLRAALRARLPEHMVPAAIVPLDALPLTPSGKVDRRALPAPGQVVAARDVGAPLTATERAVAEVWEEVLGVPRVGVGDNFFDLGGHSLLLVQVHSRLATLFPGRVAAIDLFEHRTLGALAAHLDRRGAARAPAVRSRGRKAAGGRRSTLRRPSRSGRRKDRTGREIAVVGMAGRFPGARDLDEFWSNLRAGVRSIRRFSDEELRAAGVPRREREAPGYVPAAGVLDDAEMFDAAFFGVTPREALGMNPQHRVFLECAWEALERAGYASGAYRGRIGVYASEGQNRYLLDVLSRPELVRALGSTQLFLANSASVATLASFKLDLEGPSMNVQTACSSSLVAVDLACRSLLDGVADVALAGGVRIEVPRNRGYLHQPGGIMSPTGECSPFDADARGTVGGSGAGVVVLRRLDDALADGDTVLAVIRGSAVNNDGARKVGFSAPRREGQAAAVAEALAAAGVDPAEVSYVEAHGSATEVGDPIEVAALSAAFGEGRPGTCALGAVKANVGHLDAAAGVVGLIKTVLALQHGEIPPAPYFRAPNPRIDFARSPFYVTPELRPWPRDGAPRRAGVSSFGIGGTNAHVVLEEAPEPAPSGPSRPWQLLVLSARTPTALEAATDRLAEHLRAHPEQPLADAAHTLRVGRRRFERRRVLVCRDREDAAAALASRDPRRLLEAAQERDERPVAFLFPGVGDHYAGMGRGLYEGEPVFRREVDRCAALLREHTGADVRDVLFPGEPASAEGEGSAAGIDLRAMLGRGGSAGGDPLGRTEAAHPAVFVVEYALARLWMSWGVRPDAMIGHSLGEYVAATLAGVWSLEDALALLAERARLVSELPAGAMLAVPLEPAGLAPRLRGALALAAHNAPGLCTVSGPAGEVAALEAALLTEGVACRRLVAEHAFHSAAMEPVAARLAERLRAMRLRAPETPFVSGVTGTWIRPDEATHPEYWARHLCGTVRFAEGMGELLRDPTRVLLEVGPGRALGAFALHAGAPEAAVFASLRHAYTRGADQAFLLETLGRLWMAGVQVDWDGFAAGERRRRVLLPTYPFERQAYWVEPRRRRRKGRGAPRRAPDAGTDLVAPDGTGAASPPTGDAGDLAALQPRPETGTRYVAPTGETEERLAALWGDLLGFERVGVHDDFFALGGHSLMAMQLTARVRESLHAELPPGAVFEAPTVAGLAERVDAARRADGGSAAPPLVPLPRDGAPLPASFAQRRLWFVQQMEPESSAYNMPFPLRLAGTLDVGALRRALAEVVRRHEALRTTLEERGGEPVQVVHPPAPVPLGAVELRGLPAGAREREVLRLARADALRPFDLARGPLLRATLLRTGDQEAAVLFTLHHVVTDGWSMEVLLREVSALYAAALRGEDARLPALPVQYADFAAWQREWLSGEALDRQLAYWRERLAGAPPLLEIPTDRPRTVEQSPRAERRSVVLPPAVAPGLRRLARAEGATPFMALLAGWQALLGRWSGQDDVSVGTPVAGRARTELEGLIGFFANTLVLRADLSGGPTFRTLLGRVREAALGAFAHQDLPFERLVEELQPERSLLHTPLFQAVFALEEEDAEAPRLDGVRMEPLAAGPGAARFDLELELLERGDALAGTLLYRAELFDAATAGRMLDHLVRLLEAVAADPERRPAEVELLAPAERAQLLGSGRSAAAPHTDVCLHELVLRRAAATPHAPAVLHPAGTLTYADLDRRSADLAATLRALGVRSEAAVGVCLGWSPELVVAALAVMRAGGAYLPLDPAYPAERLAYVLEDAGARVLLTRQPLLERFAPFGGQVVTMDGSGDHEVRSAPHTPESADGAVAGCPLFPVALHAPRAPDEPCSLSLAYVIYTSGTTGRPRGVGVEHRAAAAHFLAFCEMAELRPEDRVLPFASPGFDVALDELFPTLLAGAALVLGGAEPPAPAELLPRVAELGATVVNLAPAYWLAAGEEARGRGGAPAGLRLVLTGGEAVPVEAVLRWRENTGSPARLVNGYGPTETVVTATVLDVPAGFPGAYAGPVVPIGRPFGGRTAYVLDAAGGLAPPGVPGELHLGGPVKARGYPGRPEGTAAAFVPDPFAGEPGARMYRTGDRARWLPDGALEFLGRTDQQVKIRGFRIEPGEIEAVLLRHPGVAECAVVARDDAPGGRRLVAYVVGGAEADALREHARRSLPEYMVPAAFVALDRLPAIPSGKLDRRALPAPDHAPAEERYVAPRTPVEEVLAGIWADVLRLERVGVEAGFFELGGHSLLAMRAVSRVREVFGVELPLRALFEAPGVAALAERVEALRRAEPSTLPPVAPADRSGPLPLSFAQERLWFLHRLQPRSAAYNVPAALRLRGALDVSALGTALGGIVRRHEALRTVFPERDGAPVQVVAPFGAFALPVEDLAGLGEAVREAEVRRRVAEDAARPFDLAAGPLFRASLLRLAADDHVLLACMHHVVSDEWSVGVLLRELSALYAAFVRGVESPLPALPVQYADYAVWQREQLRGEALERQTAYWRERLAGAPALLELPTDRPRPAVQAHRGALERVELPRELRERLAALGRGEGATLFMTLLAAWQALLARWSGQDDVVVGSSIAGRTRRETEGLIGFFLDTLVLRTDLSGDPTFREALRRVRDVTLGAYEHQEVPFERLVEELRPERSLGHAPLFQVMFVLQGAEAAELGLPGVEVEALAADAGTSKFDLTLSMAAHPGGLAAELEYDTELFERATAARMLGHLRRVLEQVAADADRPLPELELLDDAERRQLLEGWNRTEAEWPADRCVHQLFEEQAERTPDAVAVVAGEESLTYRELNARADRLARRLAGLGVGPESRVALCLERSAGLLAGLLAVLKAGGAYVPLDPSYPQPRLAFMLEDSGARVLLTQQSLADRLPEFGGETVVLDGADDAGALSHSRTPALSHSPSPGNLAYVIYTSGSTGRPKGVMVEHRALTHYAAWAASRYAGGEPLRLPLYSAVAFDLAVTSLYVPLLTGGAVVVYGEGEGDGPAIARVFEDDAVDAVKLTPSHLALLAGRELRTTRIRTLVVGGEDLPAALARSVVEASGGRLEIHNEYGPTEAAVGCTIHRFDPERDARPSVPVGRPIDNMRALVLDGRGEPAPVGVPGELYVGGAGLARGYAGRPALTAGRFVPDPFGAEPGGRLYRTGDRARRLDDGTLEFLGRLDEQVKVRGFRVEPGEVEARLREHAAVREAVVTAREDVPGDRRLVAYWVGGKGVEAETLRAHLAGRLPAYMVPAAYVRLEALPLTPSGKTDRAALPAPDDGARARRPYEAPRGEVETALGAVWAEVLGVERVGRLDNFFELGGHSLLAVRLAERMRLAGLHADVQVLFTSPTLAGLAAAVQGEPGEPELPANLIPVPAPDDSGDDPEIPEFFL